MPEWIEVIWRSSLSVVVLFVMTKLLGKRQVTQLSMFEYITGITIGNLAAYISLDIQSIWYLGLIALSVWVVASLCIEYVTIKSKTARDIIDGKARVLIKKGKIMEESLKKERLTIDELQEKLREKNVFRTADVEFALIESNGEINVQLKTENQPVTAKLLGIAAPNEDVPQTVIMDGKVLERSLEEIGKNKAWLDKKLNQLGTRAEAVFVGQADRSGQLNIDLFDDKKAVPSLPNESRSKASLAPLLAALKQCETDMKFHAAKASNQEVKAAYMDCAKQVKQLMNETKQTRTN